MKNLLFILISSVFILTGCFNEGLKIIPLGVEIEREATLVGIGDISDEIEEIALETDSLSLIASITDIKITEKNIAIVSHNSCLLFTRDGKFIQKIGTKGRALNEYLYITNVFAMKEVLWLVDEDGTKVLKYDYSGNFIESVLLEKYKGFTNIYFTGEDEFILYMSDYGMPQTRNMLTFFKEGKVCDSISQINALTSEAYVRFYFKEGQFSSYNNDILFKTMFNDTLYRIKGTENRKLIPYYLPDLGAYKAIPDARIKILANAEPQPMKQMAQLFLMGESNNYIIFTINKQYYFFNKQSGNITKMELFLNKPQDISTQDAQDNRIVIHYVSGDNIICTAKGINENDNPRVIIAKLNKEIQL